MSKRISQIVNDVFVKAKSGEDLTAKIQRLRVELRKAAENDDAALGKFRGLLDSFKDVIPDEKQRYHAAIKALSTTSKLSPQEIVKAVSKQLDELRTNEKDLLAALPNWRAELKALEVRAKQVKDELAKLREKIAKLEAEEEGLAAGAATREKDAGLVEKAVKDLFAELAAEITQIRSRIAEYTATEAPAAEPAPAPAAAKKEAAAEKPATAQNIEVTPPPIPKDTKWQRKCPMCGGQMNLHKMDNKWICYSCAHEEPDTGGGPAAGDMQGELTSEPETAPEPSSSFAVPLGDLASDEDQSSKKSTSPARRSPVTRSKPCPSCRKTMYYYEEEKAWRCNSCGYETRM